MALSFAHGAVQWLAADAPGATYNVSGLSFQPAALRFYWVGLQSAADAASENVNSRRGVGFAVSTSSRRCVGSFSQDTATTSNCGTVARNDSVACTTDGASGNDGELDLDAINSDGFRLIVDDAAPANITVFWEAWGGSDLIAATVGDIAEPAATGNVDYAATSFVANASDQIVLFAGVQSNKAVNTSEAGDSGMMVGAASSGATPNNIVVTGNSDDASGTMDTDGYCQTGECIAQVVVAGGNPNARATMTGFGAATFSLNWLERALTGRSSIYLAMKGGFWRAGAYTIAGNTASAVATVTALPFAPVGLSLCGRMTAQSTNDTVTANDRLGMGTGTSPSSRRSMGTLDEDATASSACEINTVVEYDQVLAYAGTTGNLLAAYDLASMNSDGFQVIVDVAGGVASEWQGYVAFGNAPIYPPTLLMGRAA